ncbi:MAG TPA: DUF4872 domain-containing protein [Thermoanaerobaculia bacterium]|jgi:hypothetical protein|nr:DUF4872 domain-containing protein [Thermoanaerobaculia bacterium]
MTQHKHLKQLVRARMEKTGEAYAAARRQIVHQVPPSPAQSKGPRHFPGTVPAAAGLRVLFTHAGLVAPHTGEPLSEPMVFGIAGGIGAGVFAFYYEKEDFSSFFVAGRHLWHDEVAYTKAACERLGLVPTFQESSGAKSAEKQLLAALGAGPVLAWVDMAHLPHRGLPNAYSGMMYHLVTVYDADPAGGTAQIGDAADEPIEIPRAALAEARGRIRSQKNRLLQVSGAARPLDLSRLVKDGLRACHEALTSPKIKNFSLEAFKGWADRIHGSSGKESWDRMFPLGAHLWRGLTSIYEYIELYGTGGGLMRPLYAEFFAEAVEALGDPILRELGERYAELGRGWSALADAALPSGVPLFRKVKEAFTNRSEITLSGVDAADEMRNAWARLGELSQEARECFPLTSAQADALRQDLKARIETLYEGEKAALRALESVVG